jgi:hypothetical protein
MHPIIAPISDREGRRREPPTSDCGEEFAVGDPIVDRKIRDDRGRGMALRSARGVMPVVSGGQPFG